MKPTKRMLILPYLRLAGQWALGCLIEGLQPGKMSFAVKLGSTNPLEAKSKEFQGIRA